MMRTWLFFLSFLPYHLFSFGIGDNQIKTINGSLIDNYTGDHITIQLPNQTKILSVLEWYFYKNCVIGKTINNNNKKNTSEYEYFIANEKTSKLEMFKNKAIWNSQLKSNKLTPKIWTRWHNEILGVGFVFVLLFIYSPILLILGIFIFFVLKGYYDGNIKKVFKMFGIFIGMLSTLLLISYILELYPQSI